MTGGRASYALAVVLALGACADEGDPGTWVKRLDDPRRRAAAIERLEGFHEDAARRARGRPEDPGLKRVDDVVLAPLARTYAAGGLDDATRSRLLKLLAATDDARAEPALTKALGSCGAAAGEAPKLSADSASRMARRGDVLDPALLDALWSCFASYAPSKGSARVGDALRDAVLAVHDRSWAPKAVTLLQPHVVASDSLSPSGARKINDPLDFWQPTALRVLGALRDPSTVRPLVTVLMTRSKLPLAPLATQALAGMARAAEPLLAAALDGSDAELATLRVEWARDDGWAPILVEALAATSLDSARDAVIAAMPSFGTKANRAAAAESLVWFSPNERLVGAFQSAFALLPPIAHVGQEDLGVERATLLRAAGDLFEPRLLAWILAESATAKGETMLAAKASALQAAIELMQPGDEPRVAEAIDALENRSGLSPMERAEIATNVQALFDSAKKALDACSADADCYVKLLDEPIPPASNANWKAIKAAYMAGMMGRDPTRAELVSRVARVGNPGVRRAMVLAILHLAPSGDAAGADALEAVVRDDTRREDAVALKGDDVVTRVARMLRARAGR